MSLEIISRINKQKEDLSSWKDKLIKNLSINTYFTEDLFIISNYWLINYEKYISNFDNEGTNPSTFEVKFNYINDVILGLIPSKDTKIDKLPKVSILNKDIWTNIKEENKQLNSIMSKGFFSYKIAVLKVFENIYCFYFLDNNKKIRQGYLQIVDTSKEFQIISDLKNDGVFAFIKKDKNEINDKELFINNENYKLYITNFSDKNEESKDIINLKFEDLKEKAKKYYTTIMKKKSDFEINVNEKMGIGKGAIMNKLRSIFKSYENVNPGMPILKSAMDLTSIKPESSLKAEPKKLKKPPPRNSSVKPRILKKVSKKFNDGNFDLSQFMPKKPLVKLAIPGIGIYPHKNR
jgi:hypothetical protein